MLGLGGEYDHGRLPSLKPRQKLEQGGPHAHNAVHVRERRRGGWGSCVGHNCGHYSSSAPASTPGQKKNPRWVKHQGFTPVSCDQHQQGEH